VAHYIAIRKSISPDRILLRNLVMKNRTTLWLTAATLTLLTSYANAQNNPPKDEPAKIGMHAMQDKHGGSMGLRMKHHMQKLKTELKLSADQELAWAAMASAITPPTRPPRPDRAEMEKLSMPERLDKMKQMMAQHHEARVAEMEKHAAAVKAFYAVLTPEQKKTFDAKAIPGWIHGPHRG
jgi:Spy/CpxP family protein refolding chaperone